MTKSLKIIIIKAKLYKWAAADSQGEVIYQDECPRSYFMLEFNLCYIQQEVFDYFD